MLFCFLLHHHLHFVPRSALALAFHCSLHHRQVLHRPQIFLLSEPSRVSFLPPSLIVATVVSCYCMCFSSPIDLQTSKPREKPTTSSHPHQFADVEKMRQNGCYQDGKI